MLNDSPDKLTEFAPLSSEVRQSGSGFFSFLWRNKDSIAKSPPQDTDAESQRDPFPEPEGTPRSRRGSRLSIPPIAHIHLTPSIFLENSPLNLSADSTNETSDEIQSRSLNSVLKRIGNILEKKNNPPQSYKDSELRQYWMPDASCKECYECGDKFTTFRRRHHCRVCGQVFCSRCCNQEVSGKLMGYTGDLRVCMYCCKIVLSYSAASVVQHDTNEAQEEELHARLQALEESPSNFLPISNSSSLFSDMSTSGGHIREVPEHLKPIKRKNSVGFREEDFMKLSSNAASPDQSKHDIQRLREIWLIIQDPTTGMRFQNHRYRLRLYPNCIIGSALVDWLVNNNTVFTRSEGMRLGQSLMSFNFLEPVIGDSKRFVDDYQLYKAGRIALLTVDKKDLCEAQKACLQTPIVEDVKEPQWLLEIAQDFLDTDIKPSPKSSPRQRPISDDSHESPSPTLNSHGSSFKVKVDSGHETVTAYRTDCSTDGGDSGDGGESLLNQSDDECLDWPGTASSSTPENFDKHTSVRLEQSYGSHEKSLLCQLLSSHGLHPSWADVVLPIVHLVSAKVQPNAKADTDDMDVRHYVHVKKIPGGCRSECTIVSGVACSKNIANRCMREMIIQPRIMLIRSPISYQRQEKRFLAFDTLLLQERDYLRNIVAKVASYNPDVVVVEKSVAGIAQELFLKQGITLIYSVKPTTLERLSRCTQADIVPSVEALAQVQGNIPRLGQCSAFKIVNYVFPGGEVKPLMFFEGCLPQLGCTILLRGASKVELKKVKSVIRFMLYVAYNWRLEKAFLKDECACLPQVNKIKLSPNDSQIKDPNTSIESQHPINDRETATPLRKSYNEIESKSVVDDSDPLRRYLLDDTSPSSAPNSPQATTHLLTDRRDSRSFNSILSDCILSVSPHTRFSVPYLEGESGRDCLLRQFFPDSVYCSSLFSDDGEKFERSTNSVDYRKRETHSPSLNAKHRLVDFKITDLKSNVTLDALLNDFRARGGNLVPMCTHKNSLRVAKRDSDGAVRVPDSQASEAFVDCLDPFNHQKLNVLFCSYSYTSQNVPNFCVHPWIVRMDYYGANDISLGLFLERYCFKLSYVCPSPNCDVPMTEHIRRFVHDAGSIHIVLRKLQKPMPEHANQGPQIMMWSWCRHCKLVSSVNPMSSETYALSFAKYLELRFHGSLYLRSEGCQHPIHHDHYHYFGYQDVVASFKYSLISLREIYLPSMCLLDNQNLVGVGLDGFIEDIKLLSMKGYAIYNAIMERIQSMKNECVTAGLRYEEAIGDMISKKNSDWAHFKQSIECIQLRLTSPTLEENDFEFSYKNDLRFQKWRIQDMIINLKILIQDSVNVWNVRLVEFMNHRKKDDKLVGKVQAVTTWQNFSAKTDSPISDHVLTANATSTMTGSRISECIESLAAEQIASLDETEPRANADDTVVNIDVEMANEVTQSIESHLNLVRKSSVDGLQSTILDEVIVKTRSDSNTSSLTESVSTGIRAGMKFDGNILPPSEDSFAVYHLPSDHSDGSPIAPKKAEAKPNTATALTNSLIRAPNQDEVDYESSVIVSSKKVNSVKAILAGFLSGTNAVPLQNPFASCEHYVFNSAPARGIPIGVHDNEPSSIIAYSLITEEYEMALSTKDVKPLIQSSPVTKKRQTKLIGDGTDEDSQSLASLDILRNESLLEPRPLSLSLASTGTNTSLTPASADWSENSHVDVQFNDSSTKFFCRVYFAREFLQLRRMLLPSADWGEENFIRSLARCVTWKAKGGKSGSKFCKTFDDRFVLKQMSRPEAQSFLDFAPHYIQYIMSASTNKRPTVLAKVVGAYRIGYRNSQSNTADKMDVIVMENLFYGRTISQKFDLKGSERNRLADQTIVQSDEDLVLLDENLMKMTYDCPLYVRPHSKEVLSLAISNDSSFLASHTVMDYSLLVGIDEVKNELVVGIIDYLRTFTWDKKLETIVKSVPGRQPTIVSPESYKARFCQAMNKYFLLVPDRWMGLGLGVNS